MRRLKLQMQITVDGFVAGPSGQLDWLNRSWDPELVGFINHLTDTSDTILLGRKMTPAFVKYWEGILAKPDVPDYVFAQKMVNLDKVVFSRTLDHLDGRNVRVHHGEAAQGVEALKRQPGKDLLVYGGASFVSSLIEHKLIDELHFFVNPVAIGQGLQVFASKKPLKLLESKRYPSGTVVSTYRPD
jgi:dihydrofolate reductase